MATEIAVDLNRLERLESLNAIHLQMISNLQSQINTWEFKSGNHELQLNLLQDTNEILNTQLEAERAKKAGDPWHKWLWRILGAAAAGFVVGTFNN